MIIVREVFIAKPGMAGKLAKMFKSAMQEIPEANVSIMTDMTGQFNKVVMATQFDSLTDFEKRMQEYGSKPEMREKMLGYTDMYISGEREVYRVLE